MGLLELLDLLAEGDTLVVTHIDRLSRGLTHGLQMIEGLHRAGVEFRSLSEDFDTSTASGKLRQAPGPHRDHRPADGGVRCACHGATMRAHLPIYV